MLSYWTKKNDKSQQTINQVTKHYKCNSHCFLPTIFFLSFSNKIKIALEKSDCIVNAYCQFFPAGAHQFYANIQGISHWSVQSKSALRGTRIHNCFELRCLAGWNFEDWPQQPPTESLSNISEKLDFWWSIPQKGNGISHLGARDDPTIKLNNKFGEMRLLRSLRPLRLLRL